MTKQTHGNCPELLPDARGVVSKALPVCYRVCQRGGDDEGENGQTSRLVQDLFPDASDVLPSARMYI